MRVVVTGGSGFIGSHLIDTLRARGHEVASIDIRPSPRPRGDVEYCQLDFCRHAELRQRLSDLGPAVVCHLGAIPSIQASITDPYGSMSANLHGTFSVLEAARHAGARRVLFASTAAVYGATSFRYAGRPLTEDMPLEPLNPYSLAKKTGEEMMRLWAGGMWGPIDTVSLRLFNVFGPRQRRDSAYGTCIERFLHQSRSGLPLSIVPDGRQRRDMVYVDDVVRAMSLASEFEGRCGGEVFNIGSGRNYSVLEMADLIAGEGYPRVEIDPRPGEIRASLAAIGRAEAVLGWRPEVSFPEGIERVKRAMTEETPA